MFSAYRGRSSGLLFRKPVNANPGLKVNQSINFFSLKLFFVPIFLISLILFKFKREDQTM